MAAACESAADLTNALRHSAHGRSEADLRYPDPVRLESCAQYSVEKRAGRKEHAIR
jgi:hypothetical protein